MENASKALLMAASVLIGVLVLSLAVYIFVSFGTTSAELHKQQEQQQLIQFNAQFNSYEGKEGLTIYDVVTVANLATENNIYHEFEKRVSITTGKDFYISVILKNDANNYVPIERGYNENTTNVINYYNKIIADELKSRMNNNAEDHITNLAQYECTVKHSQETGRVYQVNFKQKD